MKKTALAGLLLATSALAGCSNSTGKSVSVSKSGFDGSKVVAIQPHGNACTSMTCTGLGAQWNSSDPQNALLLVNVFNEIKGIVAAEINIDGKVYNLQKSNEFTDFDSWTPSVRNSEQTFVVPLALIEKITTSKRTWLRVHTTSGYLEDAVVDNGKDSKALHALKRFMTEVNQVK